MDIKEIIKNLEHYNNWRRDNDNEYTMPEPRQIGITIDAAISELKKLLICDVGWRSEQLKDEEMPSIDDWIKDQGYTQITFSYVYKKAGTYKDKEELYKEYRKEFCL